MRLKVILNRLLLIIVSLLAAPQVHGKDVDFARDILPILSDNCFACHGPDAKDGRKGDLRLDDEDDVKRQRDGYRVIDVATPSESVLLLRITHQDPDEQMPPPEVGRSLTRVQRETMRQWISQGAPWGRHWAFEIPKRPPTEGHPIDHLVERTLAEERLTPNERAPRATLIRRLKLDLTGLPPTPEETAAFLNDSQPDAWERLVDETLESPAYGERMAWDWLEAARYADTNGYQGDNERTMWPWRDWVVKAFNENLSFDNFTIWQLAGDLLPEATHEQILATGFNRNHMINGEGGRIPEENRVDYVMDMAETMGTVWLGLTLNCCRCHDHKFDPLKQREYYQFNAFFNQTPVDGGGGNAQTAPVLAIPNEAQKNAIAEQETALKAMKDPKRIEEAKKALNQTRGRIPKVMVMKDREKHRPTYILKTGLYDQRGEEVEAGVPEALPPLPDPEDADRLDLARWLVSPNHPLTARVTVNRFWQMLFGIGLVKTAEDFGVQSEYPRQKELLDWLAVEFVESGWNLKRLIRTIVTSETYQRSSKIASPEVHERDPDNRLLARGPRFRMPSWMLRDQALAVSGLLQPEIGGRPVYPYQPQGIWAEATFGKKRYSQGKGQELHRRSLYTFWRRIVGPSLFFDTAKRQVCEVKPLRTNTPMHALTTLNDVTFVEAARALSSQLLTQTNDAAECMEFIGIQVLGRVPKISEIAVWKRSLNRAMTAFEAAPEEAKRFLNHGVAERHGELSEVEHAAWTALCLNVLNLDETLTKE